MSAASCSRIQNYATSFAALGQSIPVCLTAIADEFGCDIPCAPYVDNAGDNIGKGRILAHIRARRRRRYCWRQSRRAFATSKSRRATRYKLP